MNITQYIDLAVLKPDATIADVEKACILAIKYNVASICVRPDYIFSALWNLDDKISVSTVVAFPFGYGCGYTKGKEIEEALRQGAVEVDLVMNIGMFKNKCYYQLAEEVAEAKRILGNKILKIIIETALLTPDEIKLASQIAELNGADMIKTCTGFSGGVTPEAVQIIMDTVKIPVKASGGIKTREVAEMYINMGCERLGVGSLEGLV